MLGASASDITTLAAICVLGSLNMFAGVCILRGHPHGALVGMAVIAFEAVATLVHRDAFRQWAAASMRARRAIQGLPIQQAQLELMQDIASAYLPVLLLGGTLYLAAVAARLRRRSAT